MSKILQRLLLFYLGGSLYYFIELAYRGYSHWSMFLLAGFCMVVLIHPVNDMISWDIPYFVQVAISTVLCTIAEGLCGLVVNVWLDLNVWDYSSLWGTFFFGQCNVMFVGAWVLIIGLIGIPVCDAYEYYVCLGKQRPYYRFGKLKIEMPKR